MFPNPDAEPTPQAVLSVSPTMLDFGVIDEQELSEGHGQATLTVTNTGERVLVGRITVQVAWIGIDPPEFRLDPGGSSQHTFSMTRTSPAVWTTHRLGSDFIALINSNGGSETIGGYYYTSPALVNKQTKKNPIKIWIWLFVLAALALTAGIVMGVSTYLERTDIRQKTDQVAKIQTDIVETYYANETASAPTSTSALGLAGNDESVNETAAAIGRAMISDISGNQPTNTPWPSGKYPSPQQFLISYYSYLNDKDFDTAWWMLSENMQQTCCYSGAGTPIENYRSLMSGISSFEVTSAYLQAEGVNPAEIRFEVVYHNTDGTMDDYFYTAYIIDSASMNTLLIDEIK